MIGSLRVHVAERHNLCAGGEQIIQQGGSAMADTDEGDAWIALFKGNIHHGAVGGGFRCSGALCICAHQVHYAERDRAGRAHFEELAPA